MSKNKSGAGSLLFRLVLSILLVFTLLGTCGGAVGVFLLQSPSLLVSQLEKQDAAQKAHDTLQTKFEAEYNTTAVPGSVYMDVITVDWLANAMEEQVVTFYDQAHGSDRAPYVNYAPLEESITTYFEQFAAENNYAKDDTYTKKLDETIQSAEKTVQNAVDVYHIQTMKDAGIWQKLHQLRMPLWIAVIGCALLSVLWMILLRRDRPCYWIGTSLFADGVMLIVPAACVLGSGMIWQFAWKEPAVYAVFTGTMTFLTQLVFTVGMILLAAGLALLAGSLLRRKAPAEDSCDGNTL